MSRARTTIILAGGGTGGHISPILAVAGEIKKQSPRTKLAYVGEKSAKFVSGVEQSPHINSLHRVRAGKFRRYHGESFFTHITDIKTIALNFRDALYTFIGFFQSLGIIIKVRPAAVFIKGGYVGVPIGLAASFTRIPIITHDSDVVPGLANKIVGKWAKIHAVGMPSSDYGYKKGRTVFVGIPVSEDYVHIDKKVENHYKKLIDIPVNSRIIFVTGGSQGARRLNESCEVALPTLLMEYKDLYVIHQTGKLEKKLYQDVNPGIVNRIITKEFIDNMHIYSGAADAIITRAGASTLAELSLQAKACVVVPNPILTNGHQSKNAKLLAKNQATIVVNEPNMLDEQIGIQPKTKEILDNKILKANLETNFHKMSVPDSASKLASLVLEIKR